MKICIEDRILEKYPKAQIGFLMARVEVKKQDPFVESLKQSLKGYLQELGVHETNFTAHPSIALWRKIYEEDFRVKPKMYRSSIEALLKRAVLGKELWNICNVVDLYNCCSILSLLPMGGYDVDKLSGNIRIRFGKIGESFHGLGAKEKVDVEPHQVIYADDERVLCWLWNHKDAAETCIDETTKSVLFFMDAFDLDQVAAALKQLDEHLRKMGCLPLESGVLNQTRPQVELKKCC